MGKKWNLINYLSKHIHFRIRNTRIRKNENFIKLNGEMLKQMENMIKLKSKHPLNLVLFTVECPYTRLDDVSKFIHIEINIICLRERTISHLYVRCDIKKWKSQFIQSIVINLITHLSLRFTTCWSNWSSQIAEHIFIDLNFKKNCYNFCLMNAYFLYKLAFLLTESISLCVLICIEQTTFFTRT